MPRIFRNVWIFDGSGNARFPGRFGLRVTE